MNQLITTKYNDRGEMIFSGRELHSFLEVNSNYTTWFKRMADYGFVEGVDFTEIWSDSKNGMAVKQLGSSQQMAARGYQIDHEMTIDMAKEISMIQRNERGKQARQYFLHMERLWNSPDMVIKRAMDFQQQKILSLETQILEDKPYTDFGKVVSMSDGAINIGAFAKLVYDKHGINIGRNKMIAWMRKKGFLIKQEGAEKNLPKQQYIERGWFKVRPAVVKRTQGDVQTGTTLVTGKGQVEITQLLLEEFSNVKEAK
ncbi:phage antirepressor KilAC domain-containing protein [Lysinibacillus sp. LZ02]|uniref:phage antirepressor KilAC domain-containing protein n=1 Tax=Lysinibacillus sp. LZ02 TaxID=3420668 RepID=UPI003D35EBFB